MKKVNEFKDTEIGRIPKDWEVVRLKEVSEELFYGITAKAVDKNTGIKMLRTTDIKEYSVDYETLPFCEITERRENLTKYLLKKGELIVARAGTVGVSALIDRNFDNVIFGSYLIKIRLKSTVDSKFVHYFFQSPFYWKHLQKAQGSTLKNINLPFLKSLLIPLPPLPEQRKIAEILSTVDEAIQKVDEAIARTERLKRGLMQELLTKGIGHREFKDTEIGRIPKDWAIKKIGEICKVVTGGTPDTRHPEYFGGDIKWLKSGDIKGLYIYDTEETITKLGVENSNAKIYPAGGVAIALSGRGLTRGRTAIIKAAMACSQSVAIMIPDSEVISEFLHYNLSNRYLEIRNLTGHFDRSGLNLSIVSKIKVPIPSLREQQKIAEILSTVDKKLEFERKRREKLDRIKRGLMNDLLTGKRRVKAEAD
uniref:Restriction endonuclease subunit S n=1 Tax=candidate division WOR-3 bacterium TaxID=2052148 RepID=A0A7V3NVL2_UNCW3